jgi:hypothetical protein
MERKYRPFLEPPDAQARAKGHLDESCREKIPIACVVGILGESGEPEKPLPALGPSQLENGS